MFDPFKGMIDWKLNNLCRCWKKWPAKLKSWRVGWVLIVRLGNVEKKACAVSEAANRLSTCTRSPIIRHTQTIKNTKRHRVRKNNPIIVDASNARTHTHKHIHTLTRLCLTTAWSRLIPLSTSAWLLFIRAKTYERKRERERENQHHKEVVWALHKQKKKKERE